jgi:hypothetical protein
LVTLSAVKSALVLMGYVFAIVVTMSGWIYALGWVALKVIQSSSAASKSTKRWRPRQHRSEVNCLHCKVVVSVQRIHNSKFQSKSAF